MNWRENGSALANERSGVSVVIPSWNSATTVERAVRSAMNQTAPPLEVIVVDDASTDHTVEVAERLVEVFGSDRIVVIQLARNAGPGAARNAGWARARGAFVAFLDADDSWHPLKLEAQLAYLTRHPHVSLIGTGGAIVTAGDSRGHTTPTGVRRIARWEMLLRNPFFTSSVIVRSDVPQRFSEHRTHAEDFGLWLDIVLHGGAAAVIDAPLTYRHKAAYGDGGLSGQLTRMERKELATWRGIRRRGSVTAVEYATAVSVSVAKYLRRVAVVEGRRWVSLKAAGGGPDPWPERLPAEGAAG